MGRKIRFVELVKSSGRPHVVTLWGEPTSDPSFMRAVRDNRVLTVKQSSVGHKADQGTIGFHKNKNVAYLVFPESLPETKDAQVIGIKYDLLAAGEPVGSERKQKVKKTSPRKQAPAQKEYSITIKRTATVETQLSVRGVDANKAKEAALREIERQPFDPHEAVVQNQIRAVEEQKQGTN